MVHDDFNDRVEDYQREQDRKREELAQILKAELNREFEQLMLKSLRTEGEITRLRKKQKRSFDIIPGKGDWRGNMIKRLQAAPKDMLLAFFRTECRLLATKIINDDNLLAVVSVEAPGTLASQQLFFPGVRKTLNNLAVRAKTYRPRLSDLMDDKAKEEMKLAAIFLEASVDRLMICVEAYEN